MLLKKIIKNCPKRLLYTKVKGLSSDTRTLKKGDLFFALKGSRNNGEKFIMEAIKKGASAIVSSKEISRNSKIIKVKNVRDCLGNTCSKFYYNKPKNIIAVTGTNGKSSVADFFHQVLTLNSLPVATIGTLGIKTKIVKKIKLTSPDAISLHKELSNLKKKKIENVLIEASSHGLKQGRLDGLNIKVGIFTNFSQDHLDYHKSMKKYLNAKLILFRKILSKNGYIITDKNIPEFKHIKKIAQNKKFKKIFIDYLKKEYDFNNFGPIGDFQKKNLVMAIKACEVLGLNKQKISRCINKIKSVKGRLELVKEYPDRTKVFIDFAHTPDAIYNAITSLKTYYKKDITIVLGCGGERDKNKREKIGKIVNRLCNKIFITDDNPRREKPETIRKAIMKHIKKEKVIEIGNRTSAIHSAIKQSNPNEIILIAGKGHEDIQDYGKIKFKISDYKIVKDLKTNKNISKNQINSLQNNFLINKIISDKLNKPFLGVSIDSKSVNKGNLFLAINGKNNDGHNFIKEAISNGASNCVVSKKVKSISKNKIIKVSNTYNFMKKLAFLKRNFTNAKIIAVTGSSGKTTVKDLIGNLLKNYGETYFSPRSYNNAYGVPLSLCNLEQEHNYGVFEIGMSKKGEIGALSKIVKPNIAIITNIAEAHIENFKNLSHIAKAKGEIIDNISSLGSLIVDRDNKYYNYFKSKAKKRKIKVISVGYNDKSDVKIVKVKDSLKYKLITIKSFKKRYKFKIKGQLIKNIAFAVAALEVLNLNINKIQNKIKNIKILEGRGKIYKIRYKNLNFNLIDESYNANPLSMKQSILNLSNVKNNNRKYILLGDMLELGKNTQILHKKLSPIINHSNINKLFIHGDHIMNTYKHVNKKKRGNILQENSDFKEILLPILQNNDYLMIKGSNATGLNKISKSLTKGRVNAI
tara:strand:- start:1159 stop:3918 length:2760 start_codon:yes stop_codon:yes gene_type:complete